MLTTRIRTVRTLWMRLFVASLLFVPVVSAAKTASAAPTSASDNFAGSAGNLSANWTAMTDGAMTISTPGQVTGGNASANTGDIYTGQSFTSDQYSQIQTTSTQLTGSQWIGVGVRAQAGGQNLYLGLYWWQNGTPVLMLFKRISGNFTQLGTYASGPLPAGTQLQLTAAGSTLALSENGVVRISATDTTLTGGNPGIMAYGTATAQNWTGGNAVGSYAVGGTASGLSGTVVLQDNGGDSLNVTANGAFTFATLLAAGGSYNVTVASNPSGQTCTVANGTGAVTTANITNVAVTCTAAGGGGGGGTATWTAMTDGAMTISPSGLVTGGSASANTGEISTGQSFTSDQYSQIQTTSTQLTGSQWIGVGVRAQAGGQNLYLGLYWWQNGSPVLMLFKRINGNFTQLGTYASGPLPAGTQLQLTAAGSTLALSENGVVRISATDTTLTGGNPGIMAYGTAAAQAWTSGNAVGSYAVGGTASGLSGTVVLQDNGGDSLNVTANGAFTFATLLAAGGSYNVTVASNPSGQTCTVANGTGSVTTANITNVAVTCTAAGGGGGTATWTAMTDGAMTISPSGLVTGGSASANTGEISTGQSFTSDQYSQIQTTSTQLTGSQWIGVGVRAQAGGQNLYLGLYWWQNGSPVLMLFKRISGNFTQLGTYASGPLPAGTQLQLTADGSTLALYENGVVRISATDTTLTGGNPGIMAYGTATAQNWTGGNATFRITDQSTDSSGIKYYDVLSHNDGYGLQTLRVLQPTHPAAGVAHNFLYVLPVEVGLGNVHGDGLATLQSMDAEDQYNLTIVEPTFDYQPWYANNPNDPNLQYESFMTDEPRAVGRSQPFHDGHRAELADRLLEVRRRGPGPPPQASEPVRGGGVLGLPG